MSVPNQYCADGGRSRLIGATACGSIVPSHGARIARTIMPMRMAPPIRAVGCRRNASRKRRHVGDTDWAGAIVDAASVVMSIARSIPNARVEQHVREVDQKVDQHVHRGKDE